MKKKFALLILLTLSSCSNKIVVLKDDNAGRKILINAKESEIELPNKYYSASLYYDYHGGYKIQADYTGNDLITYAYQPFSFNPRDYGFERISFGDIFVYEKEKSPNTLVYYPPKYETFRLFLSEIKHYEWYEDEVLYEDYSVRFVDENNKNFKVQSYSSVLCCDGTCKNPSDFPIGTEFVGYYVVNFLKQKLGNLNLDGDYPFLYLFEKNYFSETFNWDLLEFKD